MKTCFKLLLLIAFTFMCETSFAQLPDLNSLKPDPAKEKMYAPYVEWFHGGKEKCEQWKNENTLQYYKELWYYSESFYVKRNHLSQGLTLNEEIFVVSRYESQRKEHEETIIELTGFKDVIVLLPADKLIYKPQSN